MRDGYEPPVRRKQTQTRVPEKHSSCTRKAPYETEPQAKAAAATTLRDFGVRLWWYECMYCQMWHLTSVDPNSVKYRRSK